MGAGGKTTLMFSLANELKHEFKVLICTTTKISVPRSNQFDFFYIGEIPFKDLHNNGIYVFGNTISKGKLVLTKESDIIKYKNMFDIILIEADGSKMKGIKGWKDYEPVIINDSTKTIGVLDILNVGKVVNEDNVHNIEEFIDITNSSKNSTITMEHIINLIKHPNGLFKNSKGEKIIYIPKYDKIANDLIKSLDKSIRVVV